MRCSSCLCVPVMLAKLSLVVLLLAIDGTSSSESTDNVLSSSTDSQATSRHKRAPGWGKRSRLSGIMSEGSSLEEKRAPGWGKRSQEIDVDEDGLESEKRAPGWGKRAPGWGKRAPGWGKRAPGWGKRAPGWGKRAPGWGKRAPGWGKRSGGDYCETLEKMVDAYIYKAVEVDSRRLADCGSGEETNEPFRK